MNHGKAYFNGQWIDASQLCIRVDDLGFLLGATVVERLRTFRGEPFAVDAHIRRLRRSLEVVGWNVAALADEVHAAITAFAPQNAACMTDGDDWSIVAFVTPGTTLDSANPTVCVHGLPLPFGNWAAQFDAGVQLCVVDVRQVPGNCVPAEMKCRSRMHYYLADQEARRRSPGSRALLLDQQGFVGEASTANVVAYFADRGLVTPRLAAVLPGISQEVLFELAAIMDLSHSEADLSPEEFAAADEIFLTSTSVCILPVAHVNEIPIGAGAPGPLYRQLLASWSQRVGVDIAEQARRFAVR